MLRILYLINHAGKGGTERYIYSLARKLNRSEAEIYFVCHEDGPLADGMREMGIPVYKLEMKSRFDLKAARKLAGLCKKLKIDLIHTQFLREYYVALLSRLFGSRVCIVNTCHMLHTAHPADRILNKLLPFGNTRTIAVSHAAERILVRQGMRSEDISVIHNGVDVDYFAENSPSTIREELGISKDSLVAVSIARFSPEKGHSFFIRSVARLFETKKELFSAKKITFLLVGDGETLEDCKRLAAELGVSGHIIFAGYRSDVRNILKGSDIYICHSQYEALGISILEALACSLPVITTDAGGTGEIVNERSQCGIKVNYGDVDGMADAMKQLFESAQLREQYGRNGLETVKREFSIDSMVSKTREIYRNCVYSPASRCKP
ncbi:MAG TPA: glycosyltransferase [Thermoclostridium caenicola]|uniref:glycosyltransferase n=1 Tax=Thermoclostridium caenicola TaxID=659425 RepID=UPI002C5F663B|nr:glycosyltransferase [Thermoclostridium caenicola]HOK42684.1 glycosyltransferase [Thermoclostridium caenicola]HOL84072.1 glycosyltransferase [Thermoclostridium caenicola]HPO77169.1 glycosyltransferase [Thermoclostridium caenicola]